MENNSLVVTLVFVISLSIIYTFLNDINDYKNEVYYKYALFMKIVAFVLFVISLLSVDNNPIKILITLVYLKYVIMN